MVSDQELIGFIREYGSAESESKKTEIVDAIRAIEPEQFKYLLQYGSKAEWTQQSQIIVELGYPFVKLIMRELLEWLKDLSWPGAEAILMFLSTIEKSELVPFLEAALRQAYWEGDSEWESSLSLLAEMASLNAEDFPDTNNAYDIVLVNRAMYGSGDGEFTTNHLQLLRSWGYPRISQFVYLILAGLRVIEPTSSDRELYLEILNMIPTEKRERLFSETLRKLHNVQGITTLGNLKDIIKIADTEESFLSYIS